MSYIHLLTRDCIIRFKISPVSNICDNWFRLELFRNWHYKCAFGVHPLCILYARLPEPLFQPHHIALVCSSSWRIYHLHGHIHNIDEGSIRNVLFLFGIFFYFPLSPLLWTDIEIFFFFHQRKQSGATKCCLCSYHCFKTNAPRKAK